MPTTKRAWDLLTENQRQAAIAEIIDFFATERDEEIGVIAAEELLDMFLQTAAYSLYNQGLDAAAKTFQDKMDEARAGIELNLKKSNQ